MFGVWIPIKAPRVAKTNLARPLSDKKKKEYDQQKET